MKIPEQGIPEGILPPAKKVQGMAPGKGTPPIPAVGPLQPDQVELTQRARELQRARTELARLPKIREEVVAALKRKIEEGSYEIHGERVAEALLKEHGLG